MFSRLYPLRGLPRQGQIWSWISFDVANQSFTLLINTLLFSIYFTEVVVSDPKLKNTYWSLATGISMLVTVVVSPIFGAIADDRAWKKECLLVSGLLCGVLTCCFGLLSPGQVALALLLYMPANLAYAIGENFLASFLPELAERKVFGRVSAFSWGVAYAAALLILVITAVVMKARGLTDASQWRPFFVFAGAWFLAFILPTLLFLRERQTPAPGPRRNVFVVGFVRLGSSLRNMRSHRDLVMLLVASLFYGAGMYVVVNFASILASEFGFNSNQLVAFVAVITVSGVVGTLAPMLLQDKLGHKRTTLALLCVWVFTTLSLAQYARMRAGSAAPTTFPVWPIWVLGNLLGFGLGSLGSANRAFVGFLTPTSKTAEVFGIWGLVFKLAAVMGIPFAIVKDKWGTTASLMVLAAFIVVGFVLTLFVDERRGQEAARRVDGEGAGGDGVVDTLPA